MTNNVTVSVLNLYHKQWGLQVDPATSEENTVANNNCISNLGKGSESTVKLDNDLEGQVIVRWAKILIDRFYQGWQLDHGLCKKLGGNNHHSNLFPTPPTVNRLKWDENLTKRDMDIVLTGWNKESREILRIPLDYEYLNCKDWILKNFS